MRLKEDNKNHVNYLLEQIKSSTRVSMSIKDKTKVSGIWYSVNFHLHFFEIIKTYNSENIQLNTIIVKRTISELVKKDKIPTNEDFIEMYEIVENEYIKHELDYDFIIPLNHNFDVDIIFNNCHIVRLQENEKNTIIEELKSEREYGLWIKDIDFKNVNLFKFTFKTTQFNSKSKFFSIFHLYKGLLEFSYSKKRFNFYQPTINNSDNKKLQSLFCYPGFVYVKRNNQVIDIIKPEKPFFDYVDYILNILEKEENDNNPNDYLLSLLNLFNDNKLQKDLKLLIEESFRLYSLGIDTEDIDISFLYFWNILEGISCVSSGKTELIVKNILTFCSDKFMNENRHNIESLKKLRNDRVHKGIGEITIYDVNILKHLVDCSLLFLIDNHEIIKSKNNLEIFYSLNQNNLDIIQELVNFKIDYKKHLNS